MKPRENKGRDTAHAAAAALFCLLLSSLSIVLLFVDAKLGEKVIVCIA